MWDDTGLSPGIVYYYRVKATNSAGDSQASGTANTSTFFTSMIAINAAGDPFTMGDGNVSPNVSETISYNYYMSKYEITHAEFAQFMAPGGYNTQGNWTAEGWAWKTFNGIPGPANWTDPNFDAASQPVVGVSWYEAVAFCNWRSVREGLTPAYDSTGLANLSANGYRLPTEVEWEYAAAKGASTESERLWAYSGGLSLPFDQSKVVCSVLPASATATAVVGSKSPAGDTPQGLADMSGNASELCDDNFPASILSEIDHYFFSGDAQTDRFILRGGNYLENTESAFRGAYRGDSGPSPFQGSNVGFRIVRR